MSESNPSVLELRGSSISYFTGKMENYFRIKGIPYRFESMRFPGEVKRNKQVLGLSQMPVVQLPDGRWMTDTTKMIQWFEREYPERPILPDDPVQAFVCYLLEDWADEWWWRPAMHYRWYYPEGARFASGHLAQEVMGGLLLPLFMKRAMLCRRQRNGYTRGDGIGPDAVLGIETDVANLFSQLERIFSVRPFLFGDRPTLADVGFAGPFFRHFALDPIPLQILRHTAPKTLEWVIRVWNSRLESAVGDLVSGIPDDIQELLKHLSRGYLPYLNANVTAVKAGKTRFTTTVDGVTYTKARTSQYRVWCLSQLRDRYHTMSCEAQTALSGVLRSTGVWDPLWSDVDLPMNDGQDSRLPFWGDHKMTMVNE